MNKLKTPFINYKSYKISGVFLYVLYYCVFVLLMIDYENKNKIDGLKRALQIRRQLKMLIEQHKIKPVIAIIQVGNNYSSNIYVKQKIKTANEIGIEAKHIHFEETIEEAKLIKEIEKINKDKNIDGMIVQLPLPAHIDTFNILFSISPSKDLDGLHPFNSGLLNYSKIVPYSVNDILKSNKNIKLLQLGIKTPFIPCTPLGCLDLLQNEKSLNILKSKNAVVIGNSNLVGKPMYRLLIQSGVTATTIHSKSKNINYIIENSDIIISATGVGQKLKKVKKNAIIIDVAIRNVNGKLCGDLDYNKFIKTNRITPVPKGVGPMTVSCLMLNSYISCLNNQF